MKHYLLNGLMCAAAFLGGVASGSAENVDLGALELGKTYRTTEADLYKDVVATFTAPKAMLLQLNYSNGNDYLVPYTDASYSREVDPNLYTFDMSNSSFSMRVDEGQVLYLKRPFLMNPWSVTVSDGSAAPVIRETIPSDGETISIALTTQCTFIFSGNVRCNNAVITGGGKSYPASVISAGSAQSVDIKSTIMNMYDDGILKAGDKVTVTLKDATSTYDGAPINGNGEASVTYKVMAKPLRLLSATNVPRMGQTMDFLSYYLPDDPHAKIVLTFDDDLLPIDNYGNIQHPSARLTFGNVEVESQFYMEFLPYTIEGKTVTIDLTGKRRTKADMLPHSSYPEQFSNIDLEISGFRGPDKQLVYCEGTANTGYFGYRFNVKEIIANVVSDFSPIADLNVRIKEGTQFEIYVSGYKDITYTGVEFCYTNANGKDAVVFLPKSELTITEDPDDADAQLINFNVPALPGVVEGNEIVVGLAGVESIDGFDHAADLRGTYLAGETTGIGLLEGENELVDVFMIDGTLVARNADMAAINALPKGLYIAGGKKVMVR